MARVGGGRRWPLVALAAVFVVGYLLTASVVLVRGRLLDADLYTGALARNDAYERVYTEVLADPELAELADGLLGGLQRDRLDLSQARELSTAALRWTVPPSTLHRGTETFVAAVLGYVRGDTARLDGDVDVTDVLARIDEAAVTQVRSLLATAADEQVLADLAGYRAAVAAFAQELAAGRVPATVPVLSDAAAAVDPAQVVDAILDGLGGNVDPRVREQVVAAVAAGGERDGLVTAAGGHVDRIADTASDRLSSALEGRRDLDVVTEIADRAGRKKAAVVDRLDTVRDAAGWFGPATAVVGVVLMVAAAGGIAWLGRDRPRRAGFALAGAAVAAGLAMLVIWVIVTGMVASPLEAATTTGPGTWNLPGGLRSLLGDVSATVADELAGTARRLVVVPVAAGALAAAGLVVAARLAAARRLAVGRRAAFAGAVAVGVVVVAGVAGGLIAAAGPAAAYDPVRLCNGHVELCDRRYDEVVYAATHNSMSSPDVVVVWPEHDGDIRAQLDAGVRALLIDTHHWTALVSAEQLANTEPAVPTALAEQIYGRLGPLREARDGAFLCHNQCALGAIPLLDSLAAIRDFLADNPDEVVTLIVQDAITPEETAAAFTAAGLDRYLHTHEPGSDWATLGELVERDERLVVFAEDEGPPPAWYQNAYDGLIQETPYRFARPEDFSCAPNRGTDDAGLFLMNHWVERVAPDRVDATNVNTHDFLVDRARQCERERGLLPNYLAVNFYSIGDLMAAVDTLNAVG
ncbi:MAG TPA: hypothetical protein VK611_02605 [Acidimicrobiales bacterium]|nr:hypothetical protein [Acidimicrobiales bacterium]